ncbi:hypothetical protein D3C81_1939450 [compost metagenome]
MYNIDLPTRSASSEAIGVITPWLMALFRNNTLPGSIKRLTSGSNFASTRKSTPEDKPLLIAVTTGPMPL